MVFSLVFKEQLRPNRRKQRVYDTARLHGVPKMKYKNKKEKKRQSTTTKTMEKKKTTTSKSRASTVEPIS